MAESEVENNEVYVDKLICVYTCNDLDLKILKGGGADIPAKGQIYTLKKLFFHVDYSVKNSKYVAHFNELNHGSLIGYDIKKFRPVDENGELLPKDKVRFKVSEEENPTWKIDENRIIVPIEKVLEEKKGSEELNIRALKKEDISQCINLMVLNESRTNFKQATEELESMFEPTKFLKPHFLVAEQDNKVVGLMGYSNCGFDDDVFGLFSANVHPEYQNKGIGKKLTKKCIEEIKKSPDNWCDVLEIFLTTKKVEFAYNLGFVNIGKRDSGYYLMRLTINR